MELIRTSSFINIEFCQMTKIMKLTWKSKTKDMDNHIFKEEMLEYVKLFEMKPKYILQQMTNMKFTISPDLQDWINIEINPKALECGIVKAAFILSSDIFPSVSVEQSLDDFNKETASVKYFEDEITAEKWLVMEN